jgi:putative DNA primase/helicase
MKTSINTQHIPLELREIPHSWAYWKYVPRPKSEKPAKKPFDPLTDKSADVNDPKRWAHFDCAVKALSRVAGADGIGVNLRHPYVGIDLDKCRDPNTGEISNGPAILFRSSIPTRKLAPAAPACASSAAGPCLLAGDAADE